VQRYAITLIDVPCRRGSDGSVIKNACDIVISLDIAETAHHRTDVERVVIGSGDGDFLFAAARAQRDGKIVTAVAVGGSVSEELTLLVDEPVAYLKGGRPLRPPVVRGDRSRKAA